MRLHPRWREPRWLLQRQKAYRPRRSSFPSSQVHDLTWRYLHRWVAVLMVVLVVVHVVYALAYGSFLSEGTGT